MRELGGSGGARVFHRRRSSQLWRRFCVVVARGTEFRCRADLFAKKTDHTAEACMSECHADHGTKAGGGPRCVGEEVE